MQPLVLDTNIVLDLLVFRDPSTGTLQEALARATVRWIATPAMRDELARVLGYAQIGERLAVAGLGAGQVLAAFDEQVTLVEAAQRAPLTCSDPDDQHFVDLAVRHGAILLSKDTAVLALARALAGLRVTAARTLAAPASSVSAS